METLNFNGIEWEVLDTPIAKRYSEFLKDRIDTKQFFYMGETKTQIKDEIDQATLINLQERKVSAFEKFLKSL